MKDKHAGGVDLEGAAELWPTPRTTDEAAGRGAIQSGITFYRPSKQFDAGQKVGQANLSDVSEQWATPSAHERTHDPREVDHGIQLANQAVEELWQTPAVDSFRSRGGDRKDEMGLDQQARLQWVTPAARDWKGANSETHVTETGGGRKHMDQLSNQVEHSFRPDQPTESNGQPSSKNAPTSRRPSAKKRLNPAFVCWLMGLPENWVSSQGLTNYEAWETQSSLSVRRLLCSYLSNRPQRTQNE